MTPSFLLLVVAALVFRYLAAQSESEFRARLTRLIQRPVSRKRLAAILREHPGQLAEFRKRVLPLAAQQLALDSASCLILILALFLFPPASVGSKDVVVLQCASLVVVCLAFTVELIWFSNTLVASLQGTGEEG